MKILTGEQTKEADAYTIANEPINSIDLMERAATNCFNWIVKHYNTETVFSVFCGVGNNGGDGLVIARLLKQANYKVNVFVVEFSLSYSSDFEINLERLKELLANIQVLKEENHHFTINPNVIVIDAIFGSGLARPIEGFMVNIIQKLNNYPIISIDLPSGLFSEDNRTNNKDCIIKAKTTLALEQPKLSLLFPQNNIYVGEFEVVPIGLHPTFIESIKSNYYYTTLHDIKIGLKQRAKFSHKGNFGHALIIAGSKGKMGAAILSSKACLRTGVGLLTAHVPKCGVEIIQTSVPEAMCVDSNENDFITNVVDLSVYNAIGVGPGIGTEKQTQNSFKLLIQNTNIPLVIDADAINILADNKTWISFLPPNSILTPHPKEFERLVGKWNSDEEKLTLLTELSIKYKIIIVLKGANTAISTPEGKVHFNSTGNPGMATAGSGDVLTGIITALYTQGYTAVESAIFGVYIHGVAGDIAKENLTEQGIIASDIIDEIPYAFGWIK